MLHSSIHHLSYFSVDVTIVHYLFCIIFFFFISLVNFGAIFVDVRDSSKLFSKKGLENKKETAKLIRAFTSEIIEILRDSENLKEIGIRGDRLKTSKLFKIPRAFYRVVKKRKEVFWGDMVYST